MSMQGRSSCYQVSQVSQTGLSASPVKVLDHADAPSRCPTPRVPLLVLFGAIIAAVVVALTTLVVVLDGLLMDEANRSAKAALDGSLDHAVAMIAQPFAATEPLVKRMASEMLSINDSCSDSAHFAPAMTRRFTAWQSTIDGADLPLYILYEAHQVDSDYYTWSSCGCTVPSKTCDFQVNGSWSVVDASTFPTISTTITESYTSVQDWNWTGQAWVENIRSKTRADVNGSWSEPDVWFDPSTQASTAYITFVVPTRFNTAGLATSAEVIDLLAAGLSQQLSQVTLPDTDVILVHPKQQTLLATTIDIPLMNGVGSSAVLWKMTATPSAKLNDAVLHFQPELTNVASGVATSRTKASVEIEKTTIFGFHPLVRGSLRLAVITVTKKDYFFKTASKARLITILLGLACAIASVLVALLIWAALYRSLSLLKEAMIPASRLRCDPVAFRAQGFSWIGDIAALQSAFAEMNEKLHEAGAYLPPSVRAAWTSDSETEGDESETDGSYQSGFSSAQISPRDGPGARASSRLSLQSMSSPERKKSQLTQGSAASNTKLGENNAPTAGIARLFKKARIAVLQLNFVGFHGVVENDFTKLERCSRLLTDLVGACAKRTKGVLDSFQGDHYTVTFNAVTQCSAANRKAVACALAIHKATSPHAVGCSSSSGGRRSEYGNVNSSLRTDDGESEIASLGLCLSSGVAAGTAVVGDVGSAVMRRFGVIGHVVARASVLERLCRSYTLGVLPTRSASLQTEEALKERSTHDLARECMSPTIMESTETSPREEHSDSPARPASRPASPVSPRRQDRSSNDVSSPTFTLPRASSKTDSTVFPPKCPSPKGRVGSKMANSVGREAAARTAQPTAPCVVCPAVARDVSVHFRLTAVDFVRLPGAASATILSAVLGECGGADDDEWLYVVGDSSDDSGAKAFAKAAECAANDAVSQRDIVKSVSLARSQTDSVGSINNVASIDPAVVQVAPVVQRNLALLCAAAPGKVAGRPLGAFYEECVARAKPSRGLM